MKLKPKPRPAKKLPSQGTKRRAIIEVFFKNKGISPKKAIELLKQQGIIIKRSAFDSELHRLRKAGFIHIYYQGKFRGKTFAPIPKLTPKQKLIKKQAENFVGCAVIKASRKHNFRSDTKSELKSMVERLLNKWIVTYSIKPKTPKLSTYVFGCVNRAAMDLIVEKLSIATGLSRNKIKINGSLLRNLGIKLNELTKVDLNDINLSEVVQRIRKYKDPSFNRITVQRAREILETVQNYMMTRESGRFERREER